MKVNCTASHSLVMGKEQESLKVRNFDSLEDNECNELVPKMIFCHVSCFILEIIEARTVLNTQLSLLEQFSRWPNLLHSFLKLPSLEREEARKRDLGQVKFSQKALGFFLYISDL